MLGVLLHVIAATKTRFTLHVTDSTLLETEVRTLFYCLLVLFYFCKNDCVNARQGEAVSIIPVWKYVAY